MKKSKNKNTIGKASLVAGIGLLLMAVLAGYANFGILKRLEVGGDAPYNFANSIGSVRVAVVCFLLVAILDVIVALALYRVLAPASKFLSKLAALFRLLYAGVFIVAVTQLIQISIARGGTAYANYVRSGYNTNFIRNIESNINAFHMIWDAALILFGLHLLLVGYLAYRVNYMPKLLGLLVAIAGLGYLADSFGARYISGYSVKVASVTFIGEVVLMLWLLVKGSRLKIAD